MDEMKTTLSCENISKTFGNTIALEDVTFDIKEGEILGLVGENGAGKSTLVSIISGLIRQDKGKIKLFDKELSEKDAGVSSREALGINLVAQEINPFQNLNIAENIFINQQPLSKLGTINFRELYKKTSSLLKSFEIYEKPTTLLRNIELHKKQLIEILSKLVKNSKILILDEPTSALNEQEVEILYKALKKLKKQNISIIYVSHRLEEVFNISDRILVLRDGKSIKMNETKEVDTREIINQIVGKDLSNKLSDKREKEKIKSLNRSFLKLKNFKNEMFNVPNLEIKEGEIVSLAGLAGDGRKEFGKAIFGIYPKSKGKIFFDGKKLNIKNQRTAIENGFGYLPEDRKEQGLFLDMSVKENMIAVNTKQFNSFKLINRKDEILSTHKFVDLLRIKTDGINTKAGSLSGGNQQKLLLGKWLKIKPKVLIVDEPTRGVDVGAKFEIYQILKKMASEKMIIIIISIDLSEIIYVSDKICIFKDGKIVKLLDNVNVTEEKIIHYASFGS
jgi:ribose transport system ATP-binding protein